MNVVVIGAQWGDEGKGKVVDFLAAKAHCIIRFSGGANSGHRLVIGKEEFALHLVPSGILYPDKIALLGTGMVIDPEALFKELQELSLAGVDWRGRLYVSDRAHIVLPSYKTKDKQLDSERKKPLGTTGRGIGIAYANKAMRVGIRIADLAHDGFLSELSPTDKEWLEPWREKLSNLSINLVSFLREKKTFNNLFEGAQGALLDIDTGTYPYVSSGISGAAGAAAQGGIGPKDIDSIVGVFKAYSTRVGNGPFPSEFVLPKQASLDAFIREKGREYGVTTGRPRRCGYLDLLALCYVIECNSIDSLVMTHLDVYDSLESFKVCIAYSVEGRVISEFPASIQDLAVAKPVLKSFPGWQCPTSDIKDYDALPNQAKDYIAFIEEFVNCPICIISCGNDRQKTIIRRDPWSAVTRLV